ncbi:hypothetical protein PsYK624_133260 [Phanerochaete sordida]|uniref:Uncharacterized protein n=1 Tax=Phanerochaete sordida TaxID=48140 RepID=A0A9P3GKU9_9APHY|nr:hypothetical protein PsYK624_133260 [Phanerochaete sordida]
MPNQLAAGGLAAAAAERVRHQGLIPRVLASVESRQVERIRDWDVVSLIGLYRHSRLGRRIVQASFARRLETFFECFTDEPKVFREIMRSTVTVLSGSACVRFLRPTDDWEPGDFDFYCSYEGFPRFLAYVRGELGGRVVDHEMVSLQDEIRGGPPTAGRALVARGVCDRIRIVLDGVLLDVHRSATETPLTAVAHYTNTLLTNYVSADVFCIAYPWTFDDAVCIMTDESTPDSRMQEDRYTERGFKVVHAARSYWVDTMKYSCVPHGYCPRTERWFGDNGCILMRFGGREPDDGRLVDNRFTAMWINGGYPCQTDTCTVVRHRAVTAVSTADSRIPI